MKVLLLSLGILISFPLSAAWEPFGPEGNKANNVCFNTHNYYTFSVCHDNGVSLYDPVSQDWITFASDLEVIDAFYLDGSSILVILGRGTDSDGIYAFNPSGNEYTLIEYIETPHFIFYIEETQTYYIGYRFGLMVSQDGLSWEPVGAVEKCNIVDMNVYQQHYAIAQLDNLYGVWMSHDAGATWDPPAPGGPIISDIAFDHNGHIYGIFPDESWSSGLWSSDDLGGSWEVEFWSVNMSHVCIDVMNEIFVGWDENMSGMDEGIAHYDVITGNYSFINDGLTSLVINNISINPWMSAIALFCCTDSGAFINYDYVGMEETAQDMNETILNVYPNPVRRNASLSYSFHKSVCEVKLCVYSINGHKVLEQHLPNKSGKISMDLSALSPGSYLLTIGDGVNLKYRKILLY